jgi:hypothetical protein
MTASAIVRVFCVDGPCAGVQYVSAESGHVLFADDVERRVYRVSVDETVDTGNGSYPAAYFERTEAP